MTRQEETGSEDKGRSPRITPRARRFAGIAALAALALGAAWLWFGPQMTLSKVRGALAKGDYEEVVEHVDMPALRKDLAEQIAASIAAQITASSPNQRLDRASALLALSTARRLVDQMVTAGNLQLMLKADAARAPGLGGDVEITRTGIGRFIVGAPGRGSGVVFALEGVTWRVVGISLSAQAAPPPPPAAPEQPAAPGSFQPGKGPLKDQPSRR